MAKSKKASAAASPTAAAPTKRSHHTHKIRLVLDVTPLVSTLAGAIATFTPTQREWMTSAQKSGTGPQAGGRFVIEFPGSQTRDIDEAIRALPGALQASVIHAEKLER